MGQTGKPRKNRVGALTIMALASRTTEDLLALIEAHEARETRLTPAHIAAVRREFLSRLDRHVFNAEAYQAGLAAGKADRRLGVRSEYSWRGQELDPVYSYGWHYSRGYRDGFTGRG